MHYVLTWELCAIVLAEFFIVFTALSDVGDIPNSEP